jgi:pimeloyl-ACP methyl ester carboxylesterase
MDITIKEEQGFEYVEHGQGPTLLLLHGLFGALSNWQYVFERFSDRFRVVIPLMPIYKKTNVKASVDGLAEHIKDFLDYKGIKKCTALGNSLGGHVALLFALDNSNYLDGLVLTGSSGLYESGMGSTFPRRGNYQYIKDRVEYTFYSPGTATKELVDEVFEIVNDNYMTLRILKIARAAQRQNLREELPKLRIPTRLIWGLNDNITPPHVGHEFNVLMPNSDLRFIDHCGHAAMMEQPHVFNRYVDEFLVKIYPELNVKS